MAEGLRFGTSMIVAPSAALLLSIGAFVWDGTGTFDPFFLLIFSLMFVFPFTAIGTFLVLILTHKILDRFVQGLTLYFLVILIGAVAGAAMLMLLNPTLELCALGALSGTATAILWLLVYQFLSRSEANA